MTTTMKNYRYMAYMLACLSVLLLVLVVLFIFFKIHTPYYLGLIITVLVCSLSIHVSFLVIDIVDNSVLVTDKEELKIINRNKEKQDG